MPPNSRITRQGSTSSTACSRTRSADSATIGAMVGLP